MSPPLGYVHADPGRGGAVLRKIRTSESIEALKKVPLFAGCSPSELDKILGLTTNSAVHAGQVLCQEGHIGREFFVLMDGTARVTSERGGDTEVGPGAFFGELALLNDGPRSKTVTMLTDGQVLVMTGTEFRELLRVSPGIAVFMLGVLADRIRAARD
jgi:CRP-like cAMP-binding protein